MSGDDFTPWFKGHRGRETATIGGGLTEVAWVSLPANIEVVTYQRSKVRIGAPSGKINK